MKARIVTVCAIGALLSAAACHSAPQTLPPGQYSKTERNVDSQGTETKKTTDTNVYIDEHGNKRAVQETETSTDPEGMFNKRTSTTTKSY